jgi:hypothetical protein
MIVNQVVVACYVVLSKHLPVGAEGNERIEFEAGVPTI